MKTLFVMMTMFYCCFAQVNVSGTASFRDTNFAATVVPLAGVKVYLEASGLQAVTDNLGRFSIVSTVGIKQASVQENKKISSITKTFDLKGKLVKNTKTMGVYLCKTNDGIIKRTSFDLSHPVVTVSHGVMAKSAVGDSDYICIDEPGYLKYKCKVPLMKNAMSLKTTRIYGTAIDTEGNVYNTVRIGNFIWTAENFRQKVYHGVSDTSFVWLLNSDDSLSGHLYNSRRFTDRLTVKDNKGKIMWVPEKRHRDSLMLRSIPGFVSIGLAANYGWNFTTAANSPGSYPINNNATGLGLLAVGGTSYGVGQFAYLAFRDSIMIVSRIHSSPDMVERYGFASIRFCRHINQI
jgi:hypothetical protein